MPGGAVVAAALTDHSARDRSLWVAGLDVLKQPGATANGFGVDPSSVEVVERYPGQVSSMSFVIDDPQAQVTISDTAEVRFHDHTTDMPLFVGFVDTWSSQPAFGGLGRVISVTCVGIEIILDWAVIPEDVTFAPASSLGTVIQSLVARAVYTGEIRALAGSSGLSDIAKPLGNNVMLTFISSVSAPFEVTGGTTLREAIRQAAAVGTQPPIDPFPLPFTAQVTVDWWKGLRAELNSGSGHAIGYDDRTTLTLSTSTGQRPSNLDYRVDGGPTRAVYVKGASAGGTGLVTDGSGRLGQVAYLEDETSDGADALVSVAAAYLADKSATVRGSVTAETVTPSDYNSTSEFYRPGCTLDLTDPSVSVSGTFMTTEVRKTFNRDGTENWGVAFGGVPPSAAHLMRRLTRGARA
jgi:hypothetical protein